MECTTRFMKESCQKIKSESNPTSRGNYQCTGKTRTEEHTKWNQVHASIQMQVAENSLDKHPVFSKTEQNDCNEKEKK